MKRIYLLILMFFVCVLLSQCRKPSFSFGEVSGETHEITVTTGGGDEKGDFYLDGNKLRYKWDKTNDKDVLHVYAQTSDLPFTNGTYLGKIAIKETSNGGYTAKFGGQLKGLPKSGCLRFVHYGRNIDVENIKTTGVNVSFATQEGTLSYISDNVMTYYDVKIKDSYDFDIKEAMILPYSLLLFDFSNVGTAGETGNTLVVDGITKNGISVSANGVISEVSGTGMTLSKVKKDPYYVMFVPNGNDNHLVFRGNDGRDGEIKIPVLTANTFITKLNGNDIKLDELFVDFEVEGLPVFYKYNIGVNPKNLTGPGSWYGEYYAWGDDANELIGGNRYYDWSTYKWCNGAVNTLTKYCKKAVHGTVDNKTVLEASDDIANKTMGRGWRTPSRADFVKLKENAGKLQTVTNYKNIGGVNGYVVFKKKSGSDYSVDNDVHVFFPACGAWIGYDLVYTGQVARYWCNEITQIGDDTYDDIWAGTLFFNLANSPCVFDCNSNQPKYEGLSVRAVHDRW